MGKNTYEHSVEELVDPLIELFNKFYNDPLLRNTHVETDQVKVYVRKSQRHYEGKMVRCLDIASITIVENKNRGRGVFTMFLEKLLKKYPNENFYIESIVNPIVMLITTKFGFVTTPTSHPINPDQILIRNI